MNFIHRRADYDVNEDFFSANIYFSFGITFAKFTFCFLSNSSIADIIRSLVAWAALCTSSSSYPISISTGSRISSNLSTSTRFSDYFWPLAGRYNCSLRNSKSVLNQSRVLSLV